MENYEDLSETFLPQRYQVNVFILEGRHLAITKSNTKITVRIGKKKKRYIRESIRQIHLFIIIFALFHFLNR